MPIPDDLPKFSSYLLRVWQERAASSPWRFTLVHLSSGAQRGFGSLAALVAFLEQEVGQEVSLNP